MICKTEGCKKNVFVKGLCKTCYKREYMQRFRKDRPELKEEQKDYNTRYYAKYKEKIKEGAREYYHENRDYMRQKQREYHQKQKSENNG
jgi:hypothetical protein